VPLFDDLRDDDWMDRCASFDAASATSFVRQYVDSTVSIAQAGENAPAQRSEDTRALQAVYELRLTAAFSRELHALSRNGRAMLQSGISFRLINWPGDAASRKGPRIAQAADTVLVASPSARPDLFYQEPAFTAAMTFDFARRFRPVAAQDALFQWFANATLDDFRRGRPRAARDSFFRRPNASPPLGATTISPNDTLSLSLTCLSRCASRSGRMSAKFWRATPSR